MATLAARVLPDRAGARGIQLHEVSGTVDALRAFAPMNCTPRACARWYRRAPSKLGSIEWWMLMALPSSCLPESSVRICM
jgi:hypothetical protein